jgi:hypothetical protein
MNKEALRDFAPEEQRFILKAVTKVWRHLALQRVMQPCFCNFVLDGGHS